MARKKYGIDEKRIARFLSEGRGQGSGADYRPWLTVADVPSSGRSHRISGRKSGRIHHLLSDIEFRSFLIYDYVDEVSDIREQFPLDRDATQRIATEMGIAHPVDPGSRTPIVMTTDFLLDATNGGQCCRLARTVKPADQLADPRVLEKFEIERRFWEEQGVDWGIVTERNLPIQVVKNLEWLHGSHLLADLDQPHPGYFEERASYLTLALADYQSFTLPAFSDALDLRLGVEPGTVMRLVRYLLSTKQWTADLTIPLLDQQATMQRFGVTTPEARRVRA